MNSTEELLILEALLECFYDVVPISLACSCALTSLIVERVLKSFGVNSYLQYCQLWYATSGKNYAVGFTGAPDQKGRWNGHIICRTRHFLIDMGIANFERDFNLAVPKGAIGKVFNVKSNVLSKVELSEQVQLWWHLPLGKVRNKKPAYSIDVINLYAEALIKDLNNKLQISMP
jgi:hypothetical protein